MDEDVVATVQSLVAAGSYRVRMHAVRHMIEEGFDEELLLAAIAGRLRVLEEYPEENRCLLVGHMHFTPTAPCPVHIVCDLSHPEMVDIVTAYTPQRPWWEGPTRRGAKRWRK